MSESRIDFTELREVVEAAVRYEAAIDAYERTPDGEDGGAQLQEYAAARAAWVQATNTESGMAIFLARFAPLFDRLDQLESEALADDLYDELGAENDRLWKRLDALERVAEAAEACGSYQHQHVGGPCKWCANVGALRKALDALHRQEAGEQ